MAPTDATVSNADGDLTSGQRLRSRAVSHPRDVLAEFGVKLPTETAVKVWDSTADTRYMILPARPAGTDHLTEDQLADLVTRDSMIGTGLPLAPAP